MSPGEVLAGRFEIEELAGEGGMSRVYRAIDRTTAMPVAIKVLAGLTKDRGSARFIREIELLRELDHPRVARYIGEGTTPDGARFFAMEWLRGEDLSLRLAKGPLSVAAALALVRALTEPLEIAHARGVVHRDIKPSNVFLLDASLEDVKLLDFGVAIRARGDARLTGTGGTVGTPAYMAPEQARGERAITPRVDVYALGCILFECIAGQPAFSGDHMIAVLGRILFGDAPRLREVVPDVPPAVDALVARMLSRDPNDRPADAVAVRNAIDALPEASRDHAALLPTLTTGEQRIVCVVVAAPPHESHGTLADGDGDTVDASPTHEALLATAVSHGGRLERLANGTIVAIFLGASPTDEVERAASCALRIASILERAPVALFTGRANVGGKVPFGEVIARAAEMVERIEGGTRVHIDTLTAGLLPARFVVSGGAGELVLDAEGEDGGAMRRLLGRPSRCVGRERELATLRATLTSAIDDEGARAVLITAAPGTGKSRLVDELLHAVHNEPIEVMVGRGDPLGSPSPFAVIGRVIRRAAGIEPTDTVESKLVKLRARVVRHVPTADQDRLVELLAELTAVHIPNETASPALRAARLDPLLMRDVLRGGVSDWLTHELAATPLLLVIEDLHWSDAPSVRLVETLLRTSSERPFMVLATARPEVHTTFPNLWAESGVSEMRLGMLSKKGSERLVREALGDSASNEVVATVVDRAGGHPFFLEELVRAVAEGGDPSALPETVLGMLQARLDALGADAKRLLRAASVFGETFWSGGVVALVGDASARELLSELVAKEIVEERVHGAIAGERELVFRHALVRDAAYAMLTDVDRELGHRLAARWLASVQTDNDEGEHAHLLAYHLAKARLFVEAIDLARKAAGRAVRLGRLNEALALLEEARAWSDQLSADEVGSASALRVELLFEQARLAEMIGDRTRQAHAITEIVALLEQSNDESDAALTLRKGELETLLDRRDEARASFERALSLFRARGDAAGERSTLRSMAYSVWQQGSFEESVALNDHILALTAGDDEPERRARDLLHLSMSLLRAGDIERSRKVLAEILAVDRKPSEWAPFLHFQATVCAHLGDFDGQLACYARALAIEDEHKLVAYKIFTLMSLATALSNLGRIDDSLDTYRQAITVAQSAGFGSHLVRAQHALAAVLVKLGRAEEASACLVESAGVSAKLGDLEGEATSWSAAGHAHDARREPEAARDARAAWERARALWQRLENDARTLEATEALARCARALGDTTTAVESYEAAASLAHRIGEHQREGAIWNTLGILDWEGERFERALERYATGLALYEAANDDPHAVLMLNSIAATLKKLGRRDEAKARLDRAIELARRAGERLLEGHALALVGELHLERGAREEARSAYEASLRLREALGDRRGEGWMLLRLAELEEQPERADALRLRASAAAEASGDAALGEATRRAVGGAL